MVYKRAPKLMEDARWKLHMKRNFIAERTGLSCGYVSDILSGKRGISATVAVKLSKVLKIPARKLLIAQIDDELHQARSPK